MLRPVQQDMVSFDFMLIGMYNLFEVHPVYHQVRVYDIIINCDPDGQILFLSPGKRDIYIIT